MWSIKYFTLQSGFFERNTCYIRLQSSYITRKKLKSRLSHLRYRLEELRYRSELIEYRVESLNLRASLVLLFKENTEIPRLTPQVSPGIVRLSDVIHQLSQEKHVCRSLKAEFRKKKYNPKLKQTETD